MKDKRVPASTVFTKNIKKKYFTLKTFKSIFNSLVTLHHISMPKTMLQNLIRYVDITTMY